MIDIEQIRLYCFEKLNAEESCPFGPENLVYKVNDKIFAILHIELPFRINVKCDPEKAIQLREEYPFVLPGFHKNKKHWNTLELQETPYSLLTTWIDESYELILSNSKPKKKKTT